LKRQQIYIIIVKIKKLSVRKEEREISLLTMSATERYQDLITRGPQLLQQIPLKHIASYLVVQARSKW